MENILMPVAIHKRSFMENHSMLVPLPLPLPVPNSIPIFPIQNMSFMQSPGISGNGNAQPKLLRWKRPSIPGFIAINCDGSFRSSSGTCGYGIVIRDYFGRYVLAEANHFQKADLLKDEIAYGITVVMIEMLAIRDGLRLARRMGLTHVEIQSDSKIAISIMAGLAKCPKQCLDIYFDILSEKKFFKGLGFAFIYRESNRAADFLSKFLTSDGGMLFLSSELPQELQKIIIEDALGFRTLRF